MRLPRPSRRTAVPLVLAGVLAVGVGAAGVALVDVDLFADPVAVSTGEASPGFQPSVRLDLADWYELQVELGLRALDQVPEQYQPYVERSVFGDWSDGYAD